MSTSFRRRACAVALPGIPLALLVGSLISPTESTDNAPQLRAAAAHGVRWDVAAFCELLAAVLFPLAAAGVVSVVRQRGGTLATVGAALAGLGSIGVASIGLRHLFIYGLATAPQVTALHAIDRVDHVAGLVILPCMFAGPIALIVLVSSAARARYVPRWTAGAAVLFFIADSLPIPAAEEIQGVIGIATFVVVASRLLRLEADSRHATSEPIGPLATAV
ncbi:MAG: hypothetical protein ACRDL2_14715 [Gaiellaceae bacterium]